MLAKPIRVAFNPSLIVTELERTADSPLCLAKPKAELKVQNLTGEHLFDLFVTVITGQRLVQAAKGVVVDTAVDGKETIAPVHEMLADTAPEDLLRDLSCSCVVWKKRVFPFHDFGHREERAVTFEMPRLPADEYVGFRVYALSGRRVNDVPFSSERHAPLFFNEKGIAVSQKRFRPLAGTPLLLAS